MNATRILPDLQASLLCEEVRQEANGNFFLIGVVNFIRVPQLPVVAGRLCVFNRWTAGLGQFTENIRLVAPDQTTVLRKGEMKFELRDPALSRAGHPHAAAAAGRPETAKSAGGKEGLILKSFSFSSSSSSSSLLFDCGDEDEERGGFHAE